MIFSFEAKSFINYANNTKLEQIKELNVKWEELNNDIRDFPSHLLASKDAELLSKSTFVSNTKDVFQDGEVGDINPKYETRLIYVPIQCEPFIKSIFVSTYRYKVLQPEFIGGEEVYPLRVSDYGDPDFLTDQNAKLVINWGDGTPEQIVNIYMNQRINHTYGTVGTFNVTTTLTYYTDEGILIDMNDQISIPVNTLVCSDRDAEKDDSKKTGDSNGDWKLVANVWAHDNVFSHEVGCYTHSWKKVNGSWRRKISTIYAEVNGTFRNTDCIISETKHEDDQENQERVDAEKFKLFKRYWAHANGDVKSKHRLKKGSVLIELELEVVFCN